MKLKIKDIGPAGRDVLWDLDDEAVSSVLRQCDVEVAGSRAEAHLRVHLSTSRETVLARGCLSGSFEVPCVRCLGTATVPVHEPEVAVTFVPAGSGGGRDEGDREMSLEDIDTFTHDGVELDLEPLLRELLVLAIPIAPVCREDCRGLCGGCGAELNAETCRCET